MRHQRRNRRLGRNYSKRQALLENLVTSLLKYQQIRTTLQKAKEAQRLADRVISLGKQGTLHAKRQAFGYLQDHALTAKLFADLAPRFKNRNGGYTRILRLDRRKGDGADLALLELTEKEIVVKTPKKPSKKKDAGKTSKAQTAPDEKPSRTEKVSPLEGEKETSHKKHAEGKVDKPKKGFFRDLGKFFRNKGGG